MHVTGRRVGSPVLFGLAKINRATPAVAGCKGFVAALAVYAIVAVTDNYPAWSTGWPLAGCFAVNGAVCGALAGSVWRGNARSKESARKPRAPFPGA